MSPLYATFLFLCWGIIGTMVVAGLVLWLLTKRLERRIARSQAETAAIRENIADMLAEDIHPGPRDCGV